MNVHIACLCMSMYGATIVSLCVYVGSDFDFLSLFWLRDQGSINDQEYMEKILKEHEIDIVISAVGGGNLLDQLPLIRAIKAVGTIKVRG